MRLRGRDIVCIGSADWQTELPVNQHHLMGRLAGENRVLFVESLGLRRPQIAGRDLRRIWRRLLTGLRGVGKMQLAAANDIYVLHGRSKSIHSIHRNAQHIWVGCQMQMHFGVHAGHQGAVAIRNIHFGIHRARRSV